MKASVVLITTNHPNPDFNVLHRAVAYIDRCAVETDLVGEKILSVDLLPYKSDSAVDECFFQTFAQHNGWKVVFGKGGGTDSMMRNQERGIKAAKHEWLLLCEDDTFVQRIPSGRFVQQMNDMCIPFICYNAHWKSPDMPKYWNDGANYKTIPYEDDLVLVKRPQHRDNYFVTFPGLIIEKERMEKILAHIKKRVKNTHRMRYECAVSYSAGKLYHSDSVGIYLSPAVLNETVTRQRLHGYSYLKYKDNCPELRHPPVFSENTWT